MAMSEVKRYWATVGSCDPEMHRIDYVESPDGKMVMFHDYDALKAENERLRKDAARYRWLRDGGDYYLFCITQIAAAIATIWHESTRRETPYRASDREGAAR